MNSGQIEVKCAELLIHNKEDVRGFPDELVVRLVRTLSDLSDHNKQFNEADLDYSYQSDSFLSLDSSLVNDELSIITEISDIKLKTSEMKMTARDSIKSFKQASKEFLTRSILESEKRSILLNQLENLKNNLAERARTGGENLDVSVKDICEQVNDVHLQIKACIEGEDPERLTEKLKNLDSSLDFIVYEKEKRNDGCHCLTF
jgi:hypothetical protein